MLLFTTWFSYILGPPMGYSRRPFFGKPGAAQLRIVGGSPERFRLQLHIGLSGSGFTLKPVFVGPGHKDWSGRVIFGPITW